MPGLRAMGGWPDYTAQGLQGGKGKRTRVPQLLSLGHDLWPVSELVDLMNLFVDVPDHGMRGPGGDQQAVGTGAVREGAGCVSSSPPQESGRALLWFQARRAPAELGRVFLRFSRLVSRL